MKKNISHKFFFPQPAAVVWDYLTKPELMEQWLMKNDFKPIVGHDFRFTAKPIPSLNLDGIFHCKVLELVPMKKLSYSWKGGPGNGNISFDTVVVWTLEPKESGTELLLDHSGFNDESLAVYTGMNEGWVKNVKKIIEIINTASHGTTNA